MLPNQKTTRKKCTACGKEKALQAFYRDARSSDGRTSMCKKCRKEKYDSGERKRCANLRSRYGVTAQEFEQILESQNGNCAICQKKYQKGNNRFHLDHCHHTGAVRGILCHDCNTSLGKFRDSIPVLKRAINYLGGEINEE